MFLHKQGCQYYQLLFKNLQYETNASIKQNNNFTVFNCISGATQLNPKPHLVELLNHIKNIEAHINSDQNVLKEFINKLHTITFIDMKKQATDPEFLNLTKLVDGFKYLGTQFQNVKTPVENALSLVQQSIDNRDANVPAVKLVELYVQINEKLDHIYGASTNLARGIKEFVTSISKEKELIQKEEETMTDFNKNIMSWL